MASVRGAGHGTTQKERLQRQMDELKSQLSSRRRKTAARDSDMQKTES